MKTKHYLLLLISAGLGAFTSMEAQYTAIPDTNFEDFLSQYDDIPNDGQVPTANIEVLTDLRIEFFNAIAVNIADLTGIQDFTALQDFTIFGNTFITQVNLASNVNLRNVFLLNAPNVQNLVLGTHNSLEVIEVTGGTAISSLNVNGAPNLERLRVLSSPISTIDISNNTRLVSLEMPNALLTSIDLSSNGMLRFLDLAGNQLSTINLNTNLALETLNLGTNQLTNINVSHLSNLRNVFLGVNLFQEIDLSQNGLLERVQVININPLQHLNLANGNNTRFANVNASANANSNPNLSCIQVDDPNNTTGITKDATAIFSANCAPFVTLSGGPNQISNESDVFSITIEFSTAVTGFDAISDIAGTNLVVNAPPVAISATTYTVNVSAAQSCGSDVTLQISNGVAQDASTGVDNVASPIYTISTVDAVSPVVALQDITVQLGATGQTNALIADLDNGITDNCGIASISVSNNGFFDCSNLGTNTVTVTATDASGNIGTGTATVTVEDNLAPTAVAQDITVSLDANGQVTITGVDVDNGSADNCSVNLSVSPATFDCSSLGANTVTLTATDPAGNADTAIAVVTVEDNVPLTAIAQDITVQLDASGQAIITPQDVDNGSGSGCGNISLSLDTTSFDCSNIGQNTVTLTATEGPNTETATAIVTVEDTVVPTVVTQDIVVQLDSNGQASITTTDIDNGSSDNCGIASSSLDVTSFDCSNIGANTVTLTVTDTQGNVGTGTATVTVSETVAPTAITQDITVQLDTAGNASITPQQIDNGSSDNCAVDTIALDITDFDCSNLGANTVTLTITDTSGNSATATAVVTVEEDPNQPLTAIAQDITVQLDANGSVTIMPSDVDNGSNSGCNSNPTLSLDITTFDCSNLGTNTVTLTAMQGNINSTATATVTVEDTLAPTVTTQDITVTLDANNTATITTTDINNGTSDNCTADADLTYALDTSSFDCSNLGSNTVTLTVTDVQGNTANGTATVTVTEDTAPTVITQDLTIQLDANGQASITAQDIDNGSSDDCSGIASRSLDITDFDCPGLGDITVTLTVTDNEGNSQTGTATVTITATDEDNNGIADDCESREIVTPQGFSPNGDSINDTWVIENIDDFPNAQVTVYNRWGQKVFEASNYQNDWDGTSSEAGGSKRLPVGSYLYVIELNDADFPPKQGWIYINY